MAEPLQAALLMRLLDLGRPCTWLEDMLKVHAQATHALTLLLALNVGLLYVYEVDELCQQACCLLH